MVTEPLEGNIRSRWESVAGVSESVHCQAVVLAVLILLISIPECCFSYVVKYNIFGSLLLVSNSI